MHGGLTSFIELMNLQPYLIPRVYGSESGAQPEAPDAPGNFGICASRHCSH